MDYVASHDASGNVAVIFTDKVADKETLELIVRKSAHMIEYAFLGVPVICMSLRIYDRYKKPLLGFSLFYVLAVAVTDEHIQSFSDRTSSTGDIILDFFGAMIGFLLGWILVRIYSVIKCRLVEATNRR